MPVEADVAIERPRAEVFEYLAHALSDEGAGTHVKLVMTPKPGGLFTLLAPLMAIGRKGGNVKALPRLKQRLEQGASTPPA